MSGKKKRAVLASEQMLSSPTQKTVTTSDLLACAAKYAVDVLWSMCVESTESARKSLESGVAQLRKNEDPSDEKGE